MLPAHYSPAARVLLADDDLDIVRLLDQNPGAVVIGVGTDAVAYARHLYEWLRDADDRGADVVVALLPAPAGLGHAIRDRLVKASAGRGG